MQNPSPTPELSSPVGRTPTSAAGPQAGPVRRPEGPPHKKFAASGAFPYPIAWVVLVLALPLSALAFQEPEPTQRPVAPASKEGDPGRPVLRRGGPAQKREDTTPVAPAKDNPASAKPAQTQNKPAQPKPDTGLEPDPNLTGGAPPPPIVRPGTPSGETTAPRARPAAGQQEAIEVDAEGNASRPALTRTSDNLIERAREISDQFTEGLPNFICDQITTRYQSETYKPDWRYKDRVQLELVWVNGKEDYRNIRMNGKPVKKGSPEDSGTWSTGEFGTVLADIMSPASNARFVPRGASTAVGMEARVYDYRVEQPNSHWQIRIGRAVYPAYKGALWIDPKTARVLRIEMNTRQLPSDYEVDTVEVTLDYGWVNISGQRYLLPSKSQNLTCQRGTFYCTMNEIEFKNYRKFNVESQVLQVESEISFPEAEKGKKPDSKTTPPSITPDDPNQKTTPPKKT
jgi:hypothetical protein